MTTPSKLTPYYQRKDIQNVVNQNQAALVEAQTSITTLTGKVGPTGTASLQSPNTSVTVTHNYGSTSYVVSCVPQADIGSGHRYWVDTKLANSFIIRVDSSLGADKTFEWILRGT